MVVGVNAKRLPVLLLALDEMVVSAELLEHVGQRHGAAVGFVAEVNELLLHRPGREAQREQGIRFHRKPDSPVHFLPNLVVAASPAVRPHVRHVHLVAAQFRALPPAEKLHLAA